MVRNVLILCPAEVAQYRAFNVDAARVAIPHGLKLRQHFDKKVSCKYDIARKLQLISPNSSLIERRRPVFGVRVCRSVTLDLCKVFSVRVRLRCEYCYALLIALRWERYCVRPRS